MKYHIITFGCQMNKSDSERIAGVLEKIGFKPVKNQSWANLIIVNMCSVRQSAVDRASAQIKNLKIKIQNNKKLNCKIILTGCILEKDKKELGNFCDGIFNINELSNLPQKLTKIGFKIKKARIQKKHYLGFTPKYQSPDVVYIPIMTGCNNFCAYCVVPHLRGKEISRPAEEIISEIKNIVKKGAKEIWLLGQNVNSYKYKPKIQISKCKMTIQNSKLKETGFAELLKRINDIPGDFWIRFTSSHPKDLSDELIETMAQCHKITPYINLPIQSGDDEVLKKMNRPYTVLEYEKLIEKIRNSFKKHRLNIEKEVAISSDIIVGFPGETKKQFQNTKKTIKKIGFAFGYIATYSKRPQTAAFFLKDDVSNLEKKRREKELFKVLKKTILNFNKKFLKKNVEVLITSKKDNFYIGKTRHHQTIRIRSNKNILKKFVKAKVTKIISYGLEGKLL